MNIVKKVPVDPASANRTHSDIDMSSAFTASLGNGTHA